MSASVATRLPVMLWSSVTAAVVAVAIGVSLVPVKLMVMTRVSLAPEGSFTVTVKFSLAVSPRARPFTLAASTT